MADRPVAAVVLAAGTSRRYGSPKQLALLDGRTLLEHVLERAQGAGLSPVIAVVPVWLTRPAAWRDPRLIWIRNPQPQRGLSSSLQLGLQAVPAEVDAAVVLLGDQPGISVAALDALRAARGSRPIVAASADGHLGPPVLLERSQFDLARALDGDIGFRELLARRPELVTEVRVARHAPDVDTVADLAALRREPRG